MYKYNFYIGMFDKDKKEQILSNQEFFNTVRKVLRLNFINAYTILKAKGHYTHKCGQVICEPSLIVEIIIDELNHKKLEADFCKLLNQESVLITKQELEIL